MNSADRRTISVLGLGYVGLPVAAAMARKHHVVGFDVSERRVAELKDGNDRTGEVSPAELANLDIEFTSDPAKLADATIHIVAVPTPIDIDRQPDLTPLIRASATIGAQLKRGDIVVYESTVYPGATEEVCVPVLERESGLVFGSDFAVGYSPERINPGDKQHRFETIMKVVSGSDEATLQTLSALYGSVVEAGIHEASNIRVAEAAKVIENTQRDINIALVNELAMIFNHLDIDTTDVLEAAGTKWNFLPFRPGLVGGHCIGVDPYYLTFRSQRAGFNPKLVLAGRSLNDDMGRFVAQETIRLLMQRGLTHTPRVAVLGLTFKEDVSDVRNSRVGDIITELQRFGIDVKSTDPRVDAEAAKHEMNIDAVSYDALGPVDAVILAVAHREYRERGWKLADDLLDGGRGVMIDVKSALDRDTVPDGVTLWRL